MPATEASAAALKMLVISIDPMRSLLGTPPVVERQKSAEPPALSDGCEDISTLVEGAGSCSMVLPSSASSPSSTLPSGFSHEIMIRLGAESPALRFMSTEADAAVIQPLRLARIELRIVNMLAASRRRGSSAGIIGAQSWRDEPEGLLSIGR